MRLVSKPKPGVLAAPYAGLLLQRYRTAMMLEAAFFHVQPASPPPRRIRSLMCDFDETCSAKDTIGGLMALNAELRYKVRAIFLMHGQ